MAVGELDPLQDDGTSNSNDSGACNCGSVAYEQGHPCYPVCTGTPPPAPPQQCPPMQGVPRKWDAGRKKCVFDCPPGTGYEPGGGGCKPCPPGTSQSEQGRCLPGLNGQGGGGGGGGGAGAPAPPTDPGAAQSNLIWQQILARLNAGSRFTPEVMSSLLGQIKSTSEGQADLQKEQANADLQSRGILRSPTAAAAQRAIRSNVSGQVLQGQNQILRAKIDADYQDKTQAIKEAMDWLNSLRNYTTQNLAIQTQRDLGFANIDLGYARLSQEMDMLREQYQQQLSLLGLTGLL